MEYRVDQVFDEENGCWRVSLAGEVDIFNSETFKESLFDMINQKEADLVIDCADLEYIDSTALGALVSVMKRVKGYDGAISLVNIRAALAKLFRITGLDSAFHISGVERHGDGNG